MKRLKLIEIAPFSGQRVKPFDGIKRYMSTGDLKGDNLSFEEVTFETKPSRADIEVNEGDILFAKMTNTNKALQIDIEHDGIIVSTGFSVHRPIKNVLHGDYLLHFLKHDSFQRQKNKLCTGAIQSAISNKGISKIFVPVTEYEDQIQIANFLSKAEKLINQRKESIELLDEYLKSTFLEMFGSNYYSEKKWDIEPFGNFIETLTDYHANGSYESLKKIVTLTKDPDYALMVRTTDLENNNFTVDCNYIDERAYHFLEKSKVFGGEIIINKIGSAGKVYMMPFLNRPVSLGMNAFLLRFDNRLNNLFTFFLLKSSFAENEIQKHVKGAVTKTITKDAIRKIKIPVPPILLQNQFAQIVEKTEALKTQYQQSMQELENLYGSLSQKAFNGELSLT